MSADFLLYGAYGFVGTETARLAVRSGLRPILAGRNAEKLKHLASELELEYRVFSLDNPDDIVKGILDVPVVLHCAGPFIYTSKSMVEACLQTGTHYLDITGEIPVYESIASLDSEAKSRGVMLLPGIGFDIVPTDCLAVHLKNRMPSATHLRLAFQTMGPAGFPPGTQRTMFELIPFGNRVRVDGRLVEPERGTKTRLVDFGRGPVETTRLTWGGVFSAFYSTGILNIENYFVLPLSLKRGMPVIELFKPLFKLAMVRNFFKRRIKPGPTLEECAMTVTHVWGEVTDSKGNKAMSLLHGPEAGLTWTSGAAIAVVKKVISGIAPPGYQTPAMAYGADFVLELNDVTREDVKEFNHDEWTRKKISRNISHVKT